MATHSKVLRCSVLALTAGALIGCAHTKSVRITSTPDGAEVSLDGVPKGATPFSGELQFKKNHVYSVELKKEGYKPASASIKYEPRSQTEYPLALEKIVEVSIPLVTVEPRKTPEGAKLELMRRPTLAYLEVIERSPNVSAVTRVTANEDTNFNMGAPVLSPIEDVLVYETIVTESPGPTDYYSNIQKMTVGGFGQTRLTYGKWKDHHPTFAPSGKIVVFSSDRTGLNKVLWRVNSDSPGGLTRITSSLAEDYTPSIFPDGKAIAYGSLPPKAEESQIWTVLWDGSLVTQLKEGEAPCVSPDGKKILFTRRDRIGRDREIWVMNTDGTEETQLTQASNAGEADKEPGLREDVDENVIQNRDPRWSPDGRWIVYASNEGRDSKGRRNYDIWLMATDGSGRTQLTTNGSWDDSPCWDHTGEHIYFRSNRGGVWNIWRLKPLLEKK